MYLVLISDEIGNTHWIELKGANHKILMFSETYYNLSNARRAVLKLSKQLKLIWHHKAA